MPCCEVNEVRLCDHVKNSEKRHPYLKENLRNVALDKSNDKLFIRDVLSKNNSTDQEYLDTSHQHKNVNENDHLHCVAHSCPLGKVMCCTDCIKKDCAYNKDIINAEDIRNTQENIICQDVYCTEPISDAINRSGYAKKPSWTEPRICQCGSCDPCNYMKHIRCECDAALLSETQNEKPKKTVRFSDEVVKYDDPGYLNAQNMEYPCCCCRENATLEKEQCVAKPVLVYEFPEPKLEDTSVTQRDFCHKKIPSREAPMWHPNRKDRWRYLDVPSLCETTYQCDFKPPVLVHAERKPVYLDLQQQQIDPCQLLTPEKYCSWKRTSDGEKNIYNVPCETYEKDCQRIHLHECGLVHVSPQCQCHGDGPTCETLLSSTGENFTNCDKRNSAESRYWWKRTGSVPEKKDIKHVCNLPPDVMAPVCPPYTTSYKIDFKHPHRLQENAHCIACDTVTRPQDEKQINLLCTKVKQ